MVSTEAVRMKGGLASSSVLGPQSGVVYQANTVHWSAASGCWLRGELALRERLGRPLSPELRAALEQWRQKWAGVISDENAEQATREHLAILARFDT